MSDLSILNERQIDVVNALTEWRDAGGSVELVVLAIQKMVAGDMRYVMGRTEKRLPKDDE